MTDRDRAELRGPVRRCRTEWTSRPDGRRFGADLVFREDGGMVSQRLINPDGSECRLEKDYDAAGRLLAIRSGGARNRFEYDEAGRVARVLSGDRVCEEFSYDATGRKTRTQFMAPVQPGVPVFWSIDVCAVGMSAAGTASSTTEYDSHDRPMSAVMRDGAGNVVARVELTYDDAGNLVEERGTRTESGDALPAEMRAQLPAEQAQAIADLLTGEDAAVVRTHRYDAAGRRIETRLVFGRVSEERTTMKYNEHGDVVESTTEEQTRDFAIDDTQRTCGTARFRYQYDDRGNWTEKIVESFDQQTGEWIVHDVHRREIEYYS